MFDSPGLADLIWRSVTEALLVVDAEGRLLRLNPAAERLLAVSAADMVGQSLFTGALHPALGHWLLQARQASAARPLTVEVELLTDRHFALSLTPLSEASGQVSGWWLMLQEITAAWTAEQWRGQAMQAAAHDLRNPLNLMQGSVNLLDEILGSPTPEQAACLAMLRTGLDRMNALIDQLASLEQVEGGREQVQTRVSLRGVVLSAVAEFEHPAQEKHLELTFEGSPTDALVMGEALWLHRAVANLLNNALKYTPAGGRVTAVYREVDGRAVVEISDTGLGIPHAAQAQLFERFYRVKNAQTRHIAGTGLGLAIVKAIVTQHGGKVWVSSQEGQGSTFGFSLPLAA